MVKNIRSKKTLITVLMILLIVSLLSYNFIFKSQNNEPENAKTEQVIEDVIPTIDASVKVNLTKQTNGREVVLSIETIPEDTQTIEYELSYQTEAQGLQGVVGTISMEKADGSDYEKKITLGTCSSGRCVYHEVTGTIKLVLKFTGAYGERIFEKEYEL